MPAAPVHDGNFPSEVCEASKNRLVILAFFEPDDPRLADLERMSIDRAGCFHVAIANPPDAARARREWQLEGHVVWAFRDGVAIGGFDGDAVVEQLREWLDTALPRQAERFAIEGEWRAATGEPSALEYYTRALACDPSNPRALLGLARLHVVRGDPSGGLALATRVPRDGPMGDQAERLTEELRNEVDPEGVEATLRGRLAMNFDDREAARQLEELETRRRRHPPG